MKTFLAILLIIVSFNSTAQNDEYIAKLQALAWKQKPDSYEISQGNAIITTTVNDWLVDGKNAADFMFIIQGHDAYKPDAVMFRIDGPEADTQVVYTFHKIGFIETNDWEDNINKDEMLEEIQDGTKEANKQRAEGYPDLFVDGWAQEPFLDRDKNIVYWAISAHDSNNDKLVNAKALKLGRQGYTEILWIGDAEQFTNSETILEPVLANYQYIEGFQYDDFIPGKDTVAAAGVGALVYKLVTGKVAAKAGVGVIAAILIFAKKFWFVIFLPFIWFWKKLKKSDKE